MDEFIVLENNINVIHDVIHLYTWHCNAVPIVSLAEYHDTKSLIELI